MAPTNYELGRRSPVCAATGVALSPGDALVTALCETPDGAMVRHDYSMSAWEQGARPAGLFAFWRGVVPEPNKSNRPILDSASLLDLFEQLGGATEPRQLALRSIICLILVRKRLLVLISQEKGVTLVRPKGAAPEEPPIEVLDPDLSAEALADVSEQLQSLLGLES